MRTKLAGRIANSTFLEPDRASMRAEPFRHHPRRRSTRHPYFTARCTALGAAGEGLAVFPGNPRNSVKDHRERYGMVTGGLLPARSRYAYGSNPRANVVCSALVLAWVGSAGIARAETPTVREGP